MAACVCLPLTTADVLTVDVGSEQETDIDVTDTCFTILDA